jgi:glycosyltransferase involved in cell wall biosynthesis
MTDTLVSIIIPCFRQGNFLGSAIRSALAQSYLNIEVIVVNDGSDDNTEEVVMPFLTRVKYISQVNKGLPSARNTGIANSGGDHLLFLDSDDLLHPDAISWLVDAIRGRKRTIARMSHALFEKEGELQPCVPQFPITNGELLPGLIHYNPCPPHGYLIPRSGITEVGVFEESLRSCEDWDLWLRLAMAGYAGAIVEKVGAYYRRYSNSMSTNLTRMLQERVKVLIRAHETILNRSELFDRLGEELMAAERRVYRRCIAQGVAKEYMQMLMHCIEELNRLGISSRSGILRRILSSVFGIAKTESILMSYFRSCRFEKFRWFEDTYW